MWQPPQEIDFRLQPQPTTSARQLGHIAEWQQMTSIFSLQGKEIKYNVENYYYYYYKIYMVKIYFDFLSSKLILFWKSKYTHQPQTLIKCNILV